MTLLHIRAPLALTQAVRAAAARDMGSVSDFVRRALLEKLRGLGIDPAIAIEQSKGGHDG